MYDAVVDESRHQNGLTQVWSKAGVCDVRILILTGLRLDHEGGNSSQEKRNTVGFHNSAGGP